MVSFPSLSISLLPFVKRMLIGFDVSSTTGSPFGAGTIAGADGSRQPSALELGVATTQGKSFYEIVSKSFK